MKSISESESLVVPEGVTVVLRQRTVVVTGPRGTVAKDFKHLNMKLYKTVVQSKTVIRFDLFHSNKKQNACLRTAKSILANAIKGVTKGFLYRVRCVYAHFPINLDITENGTHLVIRNFLGEKTNRVMTMPEGVTISESKSGAKDEYLVQGNDINAVSQAAASLRTLCMVRNKDIRKFLDGIYISSKEHIVKEE